MQANAQVVVNQHVSDMWLFALQKTVNCAPKHGLSRCKTRPFIKLCIVVAVLGGAGTAHFQHKGRKTAATLCYVS